MTIQELHNIFLGCSGISTDTRTIKGGELFVALKGERFDANDLAPQALEAGAAYCVVNASSVAAASGDPRMLAFDDTLAALQQLATYHRENTLHDGRRIKMLALTGTNGKTTTKELIKAVLGSKFNVTATAGNFNSNIGVPITLLSLTPATEIAVVEMGASHPGDIRELVDIAHPDCGLITNVGRAHLLGFGSFEGVKNTKAELYDYLLPIGGPCFVNTSSADIMEMVGRRPGLKTIPYGSTLQNARILPQDAEHPCLRMTVTVDGHVYLVNTNLVGSYNADNVLAALAVGLEFDVDMQQAVNAIEAYVPSNNRSQMRTTESNTLILDAYNANPSSMAAALDNFCLLRADRKALMLGDMLELGEESLQEHVKVVQKVRDLAPDMAVFVGAEFAAALRECPCNGLAFATSAEAAEYFAAHPLTGYTVLVKGSRGIRMENIVNSL